LAQDLPVAVETTPGILSGDEATVVVAMYWGGNPTPSERTVVLELMDGRWQIVDIQQPN
jgi:hypothetical protein